MKKTLASLAFTLFCLMILTGCRTTPPAPPRVFPMATPSITRKREAITT